jgi:hypothetical protein
MTEYGDVVSTFEDPQWVVFGGKPTPDPGVAAEHAAFDALRKLFARDIDDVRADFARVSAQLQALVQALPDRVADFEVHELSIELGFSATGKLVFIAEAGVEATVGVTFRRRALPAGSQDPGAEQPGAGSAAD